MVFAFFFIKKKNFLCLPLRAFCGNARNIRSARNSKRKKRKRMQAPTGRGCVLLNTQLKREAFVCKFVGVFPKVVVFVKEPYPQVSFCLAAAIMSSHNGTLLFDAQRRE